MVRSEVLKFRDYASIIPAVSDLKRNLIYEPPASCKWVLAAVAKSFAVARRVLYTADFAALTVTLILTVDRVQNSMTYRRMYAI